LNLAAAVQVISYELRIASQASEPTVEEWDYPWANAEQMEGFYEHLRLVMIELDFLKMDAPRQLMTRLRRLFYRARPDVMEINILRGILTAIDKSIKK